MISTKEVASLGDHHSTFLTIDISSPTGRGSLPTWGADYHRFHDDAYIDHPIRRVRCLPTASSTCQELLRDQVGEHYLQPPQLPVRWWWWWWWWLWWWWLSFRRLNSCLKMMMVMVIISSQLPGDYDDDGGERNNQLFLPILNSNNFTITDKPKYQHSKTLLAQNTHF